MADDPPLLVRMASRLRGEIRADTLESFRRAGGVAYGEIHAAEELRRELSTADADLWRLPPGVASQLLCAWNAFVLQSVGEHLLDADYAAEPRTAGYVPAVTHAQVAACFDRVETWTSRARQAAGNRAFDVRDLAALPDDLPAWAEASPCPLPHLHGMLAAARAVRGHAEVALGVFLQTAGTGHESDLGLLRQLAADASTAADYAEGLLEADPDPGLHEAVEARLQRALETYYHLGQLVAMPALIAAYRNDDLGMRPPTAAPPAPTAPRASLPSTPHREPAAPPRAPGPRPDPAAPHIYPPPTGGPARGPTARRLLSPSAGAPVRQAAAPEARSAVSPTADPWHLTASDEVARLRADPAACEAVREMWRHARKAALAVQADVDAALCAGAVEYTDDAAGRPFGAYDECPWTPVYTVARPAVIGGRRLRRGRRFALRFADAPGVGPRLELVVGRFEPGPDRSRLTEPATFPRADDDAALLRAAPLLDAESDPWCLTSPHLLPALLDDPSRNYEIERLWARHPGVRTTLRVQALIDTAWEAGAVDHAATDDGELIGGHADCPWGAVYAARRALRIYGRDLRPDRTFVFRVGVRPDSGRFERAISTGPFTRGDRLGGLLTVRSAF
ncbi:hypothetical protein [Actinomadura atramentaria]|uniref:hypothetical protein n=1 Tax=Actinomadura atramentaria TaxID=1990 RepID=UPI0003AA7D75|nr:hypothetical protein [Actinomadura atramentaria]